ncbi:DnaJ domain-containing protein [Sphingomonas sp. ASV193]|uniref:J domain-containing protein n=1 Tax=Sphingomonas sp. ASV193 TaxID=3144405 RepID=UPI0032E85FEE
MDVAADHYATLCIAPDADAAAIRLAYRKLMRLYHPDVNASADAGSKASAINEAYACLHDPVSRAAYDRRRHLPPLRPRHPSYSPSMRRTYQPSWGAPFPDAAEAEVPKSSARLRAVSLGLATILTIITFKLTSATDSTPAPRAPQPEAAARPAAQPQSSTAQPR